MGRYLFMANVYDLDAFVDTTFLQVMDMPAVQGKYVLNPFFLQGFSEEMPTVHFSHYAS